MSHHSHYTIANIPLSQSYMMRYKLPNLIMLNLHLFIFCCLSEIKLAINYLVTHSNHPFKTASTFSLRCKLMSFVIITLQLPYNLSQWDMRYKLSSLIILTLQLLCSSAPTIIVPLSFFGPLSTLKKKFIKL
jgi:hypothetical protein